MAINSFAEIITICEKENKDFYQVILEEDMQERNVSEEDSMEQMLYTWNAMLKACESYEDNLMSKSGLVGGDGAKMAAYAKSGDTLGDSFMNTVIATALQMGESNACMKRIVAAPTAGACGVLPAIIVPYYNVNKISTNKVLKALYVAAGIGQIIANRAYISGAAGGCQAEIGSASCMASGALVYLKGGDCKQIAHASAMAMKNLLGLVCDPVAGLVEVPCVKRNVIGAVNAISCADMALAGITSKIPPDQVIDAMKEVGDKMDKSLKETAQGGLAATQAGVEVAKKILSDN